MYDVTRPVELSSSMLYNVGIGLKFRSQGEVENLSEFKKKLLSIKAPITSEDEKRGLKQQVITRVTVFVSFDAKGKLTQATFRKRLVKGECVEYVVREVSGDAHLVGEPKLSAPAEELVFYALAREVSDASPFDDLGETGKNLHNAVRELAPELNLKKKK